MRIHTALPTALVCLTLITSSCTTAPTHSASFAGSAAFAADADPLPSWNDGSAKKAILDFVKTTTDKNNPKFVPPEERIATFDQDGTTWVSHPIYTQVLFTFDRVAALVPQHPEWKTTQPFQAVLNGDKEAMAKFTLKDIEALVFATHTGMTTEAFEPIVKDWITKAKHPRFHRPYSQMVYQPMLEVMSYLRGHGYKTYIVTGGGQAFCPRVRQQVYGIPPEQVIGSALTTKHEYQDGQGILMRRSSCSTTIWRASRKTSIFHRASSESGIRQFQRRPPDARVHASLRRSFARDAGAARRRSARICLRPGSGPAGQQGRDFSADPVRRGKGEGLDRDQHEERLEADLCRSGEVIVRRRRLRRSNVSNP